MKTVCQCCFISKKYSFLVSIVWVLNMPDLYSESVSWCPFFWCFWIQEDSEKKIILRAFRSKWWCSLDWFVCAKKLSWNWVGCSQWIYANYMWRFSAIWYHLYNIKNVRSTPPLVFFTISKLCKWYQIAQSISHLK